MAVTAHVRQQHRKELSGILTLAVGVFLALCLISYDPADPALNVVSNMSGVTNLGGPVGAYTADILFAIFGISAYVLVGVCFIASTMLFLGRQMRINWQQCVAYLVMIFSAATMLHLRFTTLLVRGQPVEAGGLVGGLIGELAREFLNVAGAYVLAGALFLMAFFYATRLSLLLLVRWSWSLLCFAVAWSWQWTVISMGRLRRAVPKVWGALCHGVRRLWARAASLRTRQRAVRERPVTIHLPMRALPNPSATGGTGDLEALLAAGSEDDDADTDPDSADDAIPDEADDAADEVKIFQRSDATLKRRRPTQLELARISGEYVFPSLSLLDTEEQKILPVDDESLRRSARLLTDKLQEYGILGRVSEIHPGPVITMFEFEPAAGIKVNRIVNAEDDLTVTMGGRSTRIVPHLPGKAAVGIEIPNIERETVWLKEIVGDQKFRRAGAHLPLAMGKDTEGHPVVADLTKMPHLLVAGATGSGKSVAINSMICSLLYKATPAEVRMILVDPKMLELSVYEGIPHLLLPVVTRPKDATLALKWALREMEQRYRLLSNAGVRNIVGYNEKIDKGILTCVGEDEADALRADDPEAIAHTGRLPYIVIIIDEMADLMMVAAREMEETVTRLAQMARAAGIHLILATQRPSVDVITGLIKANFPSRVAFKMSSKHDARTIIDTVGAEKLLGAGDMLFMAPNGTTLMRIHGPLVTEREIQRIVTHVKGQGTACYDETILQPAATGFGDGDTGEYDALYDQAVQLVTTSGQASISMVQRKMRIGYNRAARLIEKMEADGIVGPPDGSKPRPILVQSH